MTTPRHWLTIPVLPSQRRPAMSDLFAPEGGWRVRILDLSGGAQDNVVEEIGGFPTLMQANAFARRYVRDSVELCRAPGLTTKEVLEAWFAFGEDAEVVDAGEAGWRSATELGDFVDSPAGGPRNATGARSTRAATNRTTSPTNDPHPVCRRPDRSPDGRHGPHRAAELPACAAAMAASCCCGSPTWRRRRRRNTRRRSSMICAGSASTGTRRCASRSIAAPYADAADTLKQAGRLYPCFEFEAELRAKRDHRVKRGQPPIYDRAMLKLTQAQLAAAEAGGKRPYWRFLLSDRTVEWRDLVLGHREVALPSLSDPDRGAGRRHADARLRRHRGRPGDRHHRPGPQRNPGDRQRGRDRPARGAGWRRVAACASPICRRWRMRARSAWPAASMRARCAACGMTAWRARRWRPIWRASARGLPPEAAPLATLAATFDLSRFAAAADAVQGGGAAGAEPRGPAVAGFRCGRGPACRPARPTRSGWRCAASSTC